MYRYGLTGHTQGLGLEIKNLLPENTLCFSRSNNYDISIRSDRKKIIKESIECDVFISNAYDKFSQVELLLEFVEAWKNEKKCIINIGSNITNYKPEEFNYNRLIHKSHKTSLLHTVNEINNYDMKLNVLYFNIVGYIGTKKIREKYPQMTDFLLTEKIADDIIKTAQPSR
jgi:hypothetical protein